MANVFSTTQQFAGAFRADLVSVSFGGQSIQGLIVQNIQFTYQQQVTMIFEVGSAYVYYVGGRAQGNAAISFIVGPSALTPQLISKFRDLCNPQDIGFQAMSGCIPHGVSYTIQDAVMVNIGASVTSQDTLITQNMGFMFLNLDFLGAS